jgi:predicted house-cleaning noncanonical NTP pyrophosphatase (MazG superfamily)
MWFVGVQGGAAYLLPWFRMAPPPTGGEVSTNISPQSPRIDIGSPADLEAFTANHVSGSDVVLRVVPDQQFIRSADFVEQVAAAAVATSVTVELIGSSLAHPYYVLRRAGVTVICSDTFDQPVVTHNKLVRDRIVQRIESGGEVATSYMATGSDLVSRLRRKVVEEAVELIRAADGEQAIEEMADLLEVLDSLRGALGYTRDELRAAQKAKRDKGGGFKQGAILIRTGRGGALGAGHSTSQPSLFDDDPSWEMPLQVQQEGSRIRLNSVPPLPSEQHAFRLELDGLDIYIEYVKGNIDISIIKSGPAESATTPLF